MSRQHSFHNVIDQISQSNKQNESQELDVQITRAKPFQQSMVPTKNARHSSIQPSKGIVFQDQTNSTSYEGRQSKILPKTTKLSNISPYEQSIMKNSSKEIQNKKEVNREVPTELQDHDRQKQKKIPKIVLQPINPTHEKPTQNNEEHEQTNHHMIRQHRQESFEPSYQVKTNQNHISQIEMTGGNISSFSSVFEQFSHVMKQIRQNYVIDHVFDRHQSCALSEPVVFKLPTKSDQYLSSQKSSRFLCSEFKICINKEGQSNQLGTLRSNFFGSVYNFYSKGQEEIYFSILFKNKKYGSQSFRYCEIFVNKELTLLQNHNDRMIPYKKMESLEGLYLLNSLNNENDKIENENGLIIKLKSQLPAWSEAKQCFCLKFPNKNILPSVKNAILIDKKGKEVLKFYKDTNSTYNITFENPLSWIVAYGYALASTDFKLFTQ